MKKILLLIYICLYSYVCNGQTIISASPLTTHPGDTLVITLETSAVVSAPYNIRVQNGIDIEYPFGAYNTSGNIYELHYFIHEYAAPGNYDLTLPSGATFSSPVVMNANYYPEMFNFLSVRTLNLKSDDEGNGIASIDEDGNGNIYLAGTFEDSASFGNYTIHSLNATDGFIVKMDSLRNVIWVKTISGENDDAMNMIRVGDDNAIYLSGSVYCDSTLLLKNATGANDSLKYPERNYHSRDGFLMKLDTAGNLIWQAFQGSIQTDDSRGFDIDANGNIYLTGNAAGDSFGSHVDCFTYVFSAGNTDSIALAANSFEYYGLYIACYTSQGNLRWAKRENPQTTSFGCRGFRMQICSDKSLVCLSQAVDALMFDSTLCNNASSGNTHYALMKMDSLGNKLWCDEGGNFSLLFDLGIDQNDNIYFTYTYAVGTQDSYLDKYNATGTKMWHERISNDPNNSGKYVSATDKNGNTYVAYSYNDKWATNNFNFDLKKFNSDGFVQALTFASPFTPAYFGSTAIALNKNEDRIKVAGYFMGTQTFDTIVISSPVQKTFFAELNVSPNTVDIEKTYNSDKSIGIYPNPSREFINIEFVNRPAEDFNVSIYDLAGRKMYDKHFSASNKLSMNIDNLTSGFYLVRIEGKYLHDAIRFCKQ